MARYVTRLYVTDDSKKLAYICSLDRTRTADIKVSPHATVLHVSPYWSYWSDDRIIRRQSMMQEDRRSLSNVAVSLIDQIIGANSGQAEGGLATLGRVAEVISQETLFDGPSRGVHGRLTLERWLVLLTDESETDLYVLMEEYFEGYTFDVYWSRESADRDIAAFSVTTSGSGRQPVLE